MKYVHLKFICFNTRKLSDINHSICFHIPCSVIVLHAEFVTCYCFPIVFKTVISKHRYKLWCMSACSTCEVCPWTPFLVVQCICTSYDMYFMGRLRWLYFNSYQHAELLVWMAIFLDFAACSWDLLITVDQHSMKIANTIIMVITNSYANVIDWCLNDSQKRITF